MKCQTSIDIRSLLTSNDMMYLEVLLSFGFLWKRKKKQDQQGIQKIPFHQSPRMEMTSLTCAAIYKKYFKPHSLTKDKLVRYTDLHPAQ